ncbi:aspartate 1-decarboxylase [Kiritimatiella glycovorans]|uniref:Aspartate 1-decarboxylase n=1 Tax=Kiritimatiella glycovorans TaxID=1307763 RepID=A0A0G3EF85_9BACT|nr:aspartate 1-decarboxylase [Kiritimatiella glycovorans]AKJ64087.1 Aspartate 1-decarboxylase precursor [Kiritimatiella glycovorans]
MQRIMMKSKLHTPTITGLELYYEGSITLDPELMEAADMLAGEQVQVVNLNNGERLFTYIIEGERGTGQVELNGPAARKGAVGDRIIIISYAHVNEEDARGFEPVIVHVGEGNRTSP